MASFSFADKTWPELQEEIRGNPVVLLPIGQVEEHGRHLPLNTDAAIASAIAERTAKALEGEIPVLIMPTIWTGYSSKEMTRWPGTIRLRTRTFIDLVYDICASLIEMGLRRIVVMNAHGHHPALVQTAIREIGDAYGVHIASAELAAMAREAVRQHRKSAPGGAIHGGEFETSLMLHLGERVEMSEATDRDIMRYHSEFIAGDSFSGSSRVFWSTWGLQESETGIYGDPTVADAETGRKIAEATVAAYAEFIREFWSKCEEQERD